MTVHRLGDWMQTYTGRQFWPIDPRPEEIDVADIAHSLSLQCRYAGHCLRFYSVAEHSVHVARYVSAANAMWGLLHDAPEAYLVDVPRPVKRSLPQYAAIESQLMATVSRRFKLLPIWTMPEEVKDADNRILLDERAQNLKSTDHVWGSAQAAESAGPLGVTIECWSPERAEQEFLAEFERLRVPVAA